uniref:Cytochrome P450 n=1 Tax=Glossina brevipalpis TaxID=37001 RepID=A0A1A9WZ73_9MUSC
MKQNFIYVKKVNAKIDKIASLNPFSCPLNLWKEKRAEIVPGLSYNRVKAMSPIISKSAQKLTTYLTNEYTNNCETIDAKEISLKYTADIVAGIGWGIESGSFHSTTDNNKKTSFIEMSKKMVYQTLLGFRFFFISGIFPFIKYIYEERFFPEETNRYFSQLAEASIKLRNTAVNKNESQDFFQYLLDLKHKKQLTNDEFVGHQLTFHYDSFETAAISICHCLLLLARYPYTQKKLRNEIQKYTDPKTGLLKFDDLMIMPYLEQCIAETLRVYAPLPFSSKICTESCEFENNDGVLVRLKPGDVCFISLQSFQNDEKYFPQPDVFMPERFDKENGGTKRYKDMGVFLPFGDGPRICIGMNFVLAEIKTAVVEIIKHFELTVNERTRQDNYRETDGFMTGLEGGVHLNIKPLKL